MSNGYQTICESWDREFARNRELHGERIQCRPGCSACCSQLFQITEPEAAVVSAGIQAMDAGTAEVLRARARSYLTDRAALVAGGAGEEAWGNLPPPGSRLACPALSDSGACQIYDHRPLICRKFGVPLWNPDRPGRVYGCELNFRDGESIEDPDLIQIQTGLHYEWKRIQMQYNERGGYRDSKPITIARAILEDFSRLLY